MSEGWAPGSMGTQKWHYYRNGKSLCGKYMWLGQSNNLEQENDNSPDNCAECRRRRLAETKGDDKDG